MLKYCPMVGIYILVSWRFCFNNLTKNEKVNSLFLFFYHITHNKGKWTCLLNIFFYFLIPTPGCIYIVRIMYIIKLTGHKTDLTFPKYRKPKPIRTQMQSNNNAESPVQCCEDCRWSVPAGPSDQAGGRCKLCMPCRLMWATVT